VGLLLAFFYTLQGIKALYLTRYLLAFFYTLQGFS
jgi:hypothetical protein